MGLFNLILKLCICLFVYSTQIGPSKEPDRTDRESTNRHIVACLWMEPTRRIPCCREIYFYSHVALCYLGKWTVLFAGSSYTCLWKSCGGWCRLSLDRLLIGMFFTDKMVAGCLNQDLYRGSFSIPIESFRRTESKCGPCFYIPKCQLSGRECPGNEGLHMAFYKRAFFWAPVDRSQRAQSLSEVDTSAWTWSKTHWEGGLAHVTMR